MNNEKDNAYESRLMQAQTAVGYLTFLIKSFENKNIKVLNQSADVNTVETAQRLFSLYLIILEVNEFQTHFIHIQNKKNNQVFNGKLI